MSAPARMPFLRRGSLAGARSVIARTRGETLCRCLMCVLAPCSAPMAVVTVGSVNRLEGDFGIARNAVGADGYRADVYWGFAG
jgi:hypothetical protein